MISLYPSPSKVSENHVFISIPSFKKPKREDLLTRDYTLHYLKDQDTDNISMHRGDDWDTVGHRGPRKAGSRSLRSWFNAQGSHPPTPDQRSLLDNVEVQDGDLEMQSVI